MNDVLITYLALPHSVRGLVCPTPEGDYRVVLNSQLPPEQQRRTFEHELRHILENHFSRTEEPLAHLEADADRHGRWQAIIEKAEEQGLPLAPPPEAAYPKAAVLPQEAACPPEAAYPPAAVLPQEAAPPPEAACPPAAVLPQEAVPPHQSGAIPPVVIPPAPAAKPSHSAALLAARRAQLTGLRY